MVQNAKKKAKAKSGKQKISAPRKKKSATPTTPEGQAEAKAIAKTSTINKDVIRETLSEQFSALRATLNSLNGDAVKQPRPLRLALSVLGEAEKAAERAVQLQE